MKKWGGRSKFPPPPATPLDKSTKFSFAQTKIWTVKIKMRVDKTLSHHLAYTTSQPSRDSNIPNPSLNVMDRYLGKLLGLTQTLCLKDVEVLTLNAR